MFRRNDIGSYAWFIFSKSILVKFAFDSFENNDIGTYAWSIFEKSIILKFAFNTCWKNDIGNYAWFIFSKSIIPKLSSNTFWNMILVVMHDSYFQTRFFWHVLLTHSEQNDICSYAWIIFSKSILVKCAINKIWKTDIVNHAWFIFSKPILAKYALNKFWKNDIDIYACFIFSKWVLVKFAVDKFWKWYLSLCMIHIYKIDSSEMFFSIFVLNVFCDYAWFIFPTSILLSLLLPQFEQIIFVNMHDSYFQHRFLPYCTVPCRSIPYHTVPYRTVP